MPIRPSHEILPKMYQLGQILAHSQNICYSRTTSYYYLTRKFADHVQLSLSHRLQEKPIKFCLSMQIAATIIIQYELESKYSSIRPSCPNKKNLEKTNSSRSFLCANKVIRIDHLSKRQYTESLSRGIHLSVCALAREAYPNEPPF